MQFIFGENMPPAVHDIGETLRQIGHNFLTTRSLIVLVLSISLALIVGRIIASVLRRVVMMIGKRADKSENLHTVNRLRRYETLIVLSIALIRTALLMFAIYFWWMYVHPSGRPTALIGASALALVIVSGALGPTLRDIASGSLMMVEQWYGVGDHIRVEPFADLQGVVERVTLRSTRIRGLNGEVIWLNNQYIQGIRIAPKGIRRIGLELFVNDLKAGKKLIETTNERLPSGPLLVVSPLYVESANQVGQSLWHITAVGETAPGREWLIETYAIKLVKEIDEAKKSSVLAHDPIARYADSDAERRFTRTITNARKRPAPKKPSPAAKKARATAQKITTKRPAKR